MVAGSSASTVSEPALDVDEIQGNVLGGFNTDYQLVWTFACAETAALRAALLAILPDISSLREVEGRRRQRRAEMRATGREAAPSRELRACIGISFAGLERLQGDAAEFKDPVFKRGLNLEAARHLGDPQEPGHRGNALAWRVGGGGPAPDAILILGCDHRKPIDERRAELEALFARLGVRTLTCDLGANPATFSTEAYVWPSGIEHFGFKDGIAQPAVRGRLEDGTFLAPRTLAEPSEPSEIAYALPGKALIWPGAFVVGYPVQNQALPALSSPAWPLGPSGIAPLWARNGSFLVFRRLAQDVPLFNLFLARECARNNQDPAATPLTPETLGALIVGRWRSGAPLMRSPEHDSPSLGHASGANDAFAYESPIPVSDGFPAPPSDPSGIVCPFSAHVRKVNPRDATTDKGGPADTLHRRILRRGIPYGEPLPIGATADSKNGERGLLFLAFMTSIGDQFELVANDWMNSPINPAPVATGFDMLLGQNPQDGRIRTASIPREGVTFTVSNAGSSSPDWVFPTGGGYFFTPSLSALRMLAEPPPVPPPLEPPA
jgi:Dyp-type peroxidase family